MNSQDVTVLVNKIEIVLKKSYIVSTTFQDIENGIVDTKRRRVVYFILGVMIMYFIILTTWTVAPEDSSFHFYFFNPFHGFGKIGRFLAAFLAAGGLMVMLHYFAVLKQEKRSSLTPVTGLRHMFDRLGHPSSKDTKKLTLFMKLLALIPWFKVILVLPLIILMAIGSIITAYVFDSSLFLLLRILALLVEGFVVLAPASQIFSVVHLLIAQSSIYLTMRLDGNCEYLSQVSKQSSHISLRHVSRALLDLHIILNEIRNHNECIKYFLRDSMLCIECCISCSMVFVMESNAWYEQSFLLSVTVSLVIFLSFSTLNASYLFVKIRETAKLLHSLQEKIHTLQSVSRHRSASVLVRNKEDCHLNDVIKAKHQILRLIHRMSSPFLKVGFTEGDVDSFTPMSVASSVSTIVCTSLMFLNAKYSSL